MRVVGGAVFVLGVCLFVGNITGMFPTFSGLGWLTAAIGGGIYRSGTKD